MIRVATQKDAEQILELLIVAHGESARISIPYVRDKALSSIRTYVDNPAIFSMVADRDGEIVGILFGAIAAPWYSNAKVAGDIEFYVRSDARGDGIALDYAFTAWAKGFDAVVEIQRGITVGGSDAVKTGEFYSRRGYEPVGQNFVKRVK